MIEIYDTWQKPVKVDTNGVRDKPASDVETVRDEMALRIESHLVAGETAMLCCSVPCGVGKSYTAKNEGENIAEITGQNISWFSPRHNGYNSLERDNEWTQIYGRYGDKHSKNGELLEAGNCDYADYCKNVFQKGYSSAIVVCSPKDESRRKPNVWKCPIARENCEFWQQFETNGHWHMPSEFIPACKLWSASNSLVVLDEIDSTNLVPDAVIISPDVMNQWAEKYPRVAKYLKAIQTLIIDTSISDSELYEALLSVLDGRNLLLLYAVVETIPDTYDVTSIDDIDGLPDNRCKDFLLTIVSELGSYQNGKGVVSRIVAHPDHFTFYPKLDLSKQFIDIYNESRTLKELPSVLLNATADIDGLKHLLSDEDYKIDVYNPHVALHPDCKVIYDISRNNSKSSVNGRDTYRNRWISQIRDFVADVKTLVICTMDGERLLKNELADLVESGLVELAHYGNVSGLNRFEDCQQVILAQPFQPPPIAVAERYRQIYGGTIGKPLDLSTCFRQVTIDDGNTAYNVTVRTMRDSRLRPIYEAWRNSEHYQAAHRVRPVLHKRDVIILFAIPIEGLSATDIIYSVSKSGRKQKMNELENAAIELLDTQGYVTQADLKKSGFSHGFVVKHWDKLGQELGLNETKAMVKGKRYKHKGQTVKALTDTATDETFNIGDWVIYNFVAYDAISWDTIGTRQMNGKITGKKSEHWFYIDDKLVPKPCVVSKAYYVN